MHTRTDSYVDRTVKRYNFLFQLPSYVGITCSLAALSLLGGIFMTLPFYPSYLGLGLGSAFGGLFLVLTILSDLAISRISMKLDLIFNLRRCSALSLFSSLVWFGILTLSSVFTALVLQQDVWMKGFFLGFFGTVVLRFLVFSTVSFRPFLSVLFSSLLQPSVCILPLVFFDSKIFSGLTVNMFFFYSISICLAVLTVLLFKYLVDRVGSRTLGVASSSLFKAFLANWAEDLNVPLETFFEKLGDIQEVQTSLISFSTSQKLKAVMVIPALHPGPFKNLGSSALPSLLQTTFEEKLHCVVSVPHGLTGHELDLSSQLQTQRVVNEILRLVSPSLGASTASPFVRSIDDGAIVSCQRFGDVTLFTLTLAPQPMEDLPTEIESFIGQKTAQLNLQPLVIDAHNSINGNFDADKAIRTFKKAVTQCVKAFLNQPCFPFRVGAATVFPKEFTTKDGLGPGGISVIVINVNDQKVAYVTIDGNNMVSGLRERILAALEEIGIDDGEILTTDTHVVCGIVSTPRGYHPIGEVMDHHRLIEHIKAATLQALDDLEPATASWNTGVIPNVNVIGEHQIEEISRVTDIAAKRARRLGATLFPLTGLFLVCTFMFL